MVRPVAYDITRLATRLLNRTPNGIDRIDGAFARHFIDPSRRDRFGLMLSPLGPRIVAPKKARAIVDGIAHHWGENDRPDDDAAYRKIVAWLGAAAPTSSATEHIVRGRTGRVRRVVRFIGRNGLPLGPSPAKALPRGAVYLNVSQFPLWVAGYFGWMDRRPDITPVFFIHDLLPLETPEYFRKGEPQRHRRRLANLARFGAAAIVTSEVVRTALERQLKGLGHTGLPIFVAPLPATAIFSRREAPDPELVAHPYFVVCGTIEPRKNHLMLLQVWRELVRRDGAAAPKLILIGARGWENENVVDLLERSATISHHVLEVSGLSTPSFKRLLDGACALLMPSFAEGYGLPLVEALAAGVPVIASDLEVFRETGGARITAISPIDGEKWLAAIRAFARAGRAQRHALPTETENRGAGWDGYFRAIESFLAGL